MIRRRHPDAPRTARRRRIARPAALVLWLAPATAIAQSTPPPDATGTSPAPANPADVTATAPPVTPASPAPYPQASSPAPTVAPLSSATLPSQASSPPATTPPASSAPPPPLPSPPTPDDLLAMGAGAPLERFAGSRTVITARDIARTAPVSTAEMLRYVPGLQQREDDPFGLRLSFGMRGYDPALSGRLTVLEDGIPIAVGPYGRNDLAYVTPIEFVQRIEVLRGLGTLSFGPQTAGGVINFLTPAAPRRETVALRALGGYPLLLGAAGMYGNTVGNASFVLSVMRRQGDGPRQSPFEITEALARFRLELGPRSDLTVRLQVWDQGATISSTGLTSSMFDVPVRRVLALTPFDWTRNRRYAAGLVHEYRIADNLRVRTILHGAVTERRAWEQSFDRAPVDRLAYSRITGDVTTPNAALYFRDANTSTPGMFYVAGIEPRLQAGFRLSGFRNELEIGGRVQFERAEIQDAFGGTAYARSGTVKNDSINEGFGVAVYLQDRLYLTDAWQVSAGLRFDSFSFTRVVRRVDGIDTYDRRQNSNVGILPGGVLSYVQPQFAFFAGLHRGWLPTRYEQSLGAPAPAVGAAPQLNRVDPEDSINSELGARVQIADALHVEATAFWIERFNPIVRGPWGWVNDFPARHLGGEAMVQADFGRLAHVSTNVYLNAQYQFVDARFEIGPNRDHMLPYVAPHTVIATAGIEHPFGIGAQVSWRYVSERFADLANTNAPSVDGTTGSIPAFHTLDVSAQYTHHDTGLGIVLGAKNVLDMQYIASRADNGIQPGGYRQLFVSLRWDH